MVKFSASRSEDLLLALGANVAGRWGDPRATLARACRELDAAGVKIITSSHFYKTAPMDTSDRQPGYLNAVVVARTSLGPGTLLRLVKRLERSAGRKQTPPMQARPLDIDILDFGGRRVNWPGGPRVRGRLVLPHPLLHARAFVLVPLMEVAPGWSHPVLGARARTLLARLSPAAVRGVQRVGRRRP